MTQDLTRLGEINALLGRGTEYEGKLCFEGRVRIDGKFRGAIYSEDMLILGDGADVDAELHVGKLIVRGGTLRGRVFASQLVEIFAPARVLADVETPLFFVERGAVFGGRCTMNDADVAPTEIDAPQSARIAASAVVVPSPPAPTPAAAFVSAESPPMPVSVDPTPDPEPAPISQPAELRESVPDDDGAESAPAEPDVDDAKPKRKRSRKRA